MKQKLAALVVVVSLTLLSAPVSALNSGGISIHPVNSGDKTRSSFSFNVSSKQSLNDAVMVTNTSAEAKNVNVYFVDGTISADGTFACGLQKDKKQDVASWTEVATQKVHINSIATAKIPFSISVPNAVEPGEHNGCIVAEEDLPSGSKQAFSYRMAIRVSVTIPGELNQLMSISNVHVKEENGKFFAKATLSNTGNVSLKAKLSATATSSFNKKTQISLPQQTIVRGSKVYISQAIPRPFWGGNLKLEIHGTYDSYAPHKGLGPKSINTASAATFVSPTNSAIFLLILIVAAVVILTILLVKFIKRQKQYKQWQTYTVRDGDNIKNLGERTSTSWKYIARKNRIAKPYVLTPDQKIKIPKFTKTISVEK